MLLPAHASLDDLGEEISTMASRLWAGTATFLALLGEFDSREGFWHWGIGSCAQWLSWHCGLSPTAARDHVRVARALQRLPRIASAFGAGELSYSKVRAITRVANDSTEELLLTWARYGTAAQLERIVRGYRRAEAAMDPQKVHNRRSLTYYFDDDGSMVLHARLSPEDGSTFVRALDAAEAERAANAAVVHSDDSAESSPAPSPDDWDVSNPWEQRRADALAHLAEAFLSGSIRTDGTQERAMIVLHTDESTLAGPRCELKPGGQVSPETARRLACDAGLIRVTDGGVTTIGRRTRVVPTSMRRALHRRDHGCRFPACSARTVDAHHVRHWARGGHTSLDNLVLLCRRHHRLVHEGGFGLQMPEPGAPTFTRPDGRAIEPPSGQDPPNALPSEGFGPRTCATHWDGYTPNYSNAVSSLFEVEARALR